jgi:ABC-type glycerol-3-phosphate transport system permease component
MISRRKLSDMLINLLLYVVLIGISIFMLLPFIWMLSTSLKPENEIFKLPPVIISPNFNLNSYRNLIEQRHILRIVANTFIIARALLCCSYSSALADMASPSSNSRDAKTLCHPAGHDDRAFTVLMALYIIMLNLGWIDSFWPMIIPVRPAPSASSSCASTSQRPDELLDAARIDGAGEFAIFRRIILPIIMPGLTSLGLIFFMAAWNNFMWPLVILKSPDNFTLPIAIRSYVGGVIGRPVFNLQMAASIISILPLLLIFLGFQRRFVEGITAEPSRLGVNDRDSFWREYYPEHWPAERWPSTLIDASSRFQHRAHGGVCLVNLGTAKRCFDFAWLDRAIEILAHAASVPF